MIVASDRKKNEKYMRSQTESIENVLEEKKMRPIDRLKMGKKSLYFSEQNKVDLTYDFYEFIDKQKSQKSLKRM